MAQKFSLLGYFHIVVRSQWQWWVSQWTQSVAKRTKEMPPEKDSRWAQAKKEETKPRACDSKGIEKFIDRLRHCSFSHWKCVQFSAWWSMVMLAWRKNIRNFSMCVWKPATKGHRNQLSAFYIFPFYFIVCVCLRVRMKEYVRAHLQVPLSFGSIETLPRNLLNDFLFSELLPSLLNFNKGMRWK